MKTYIKQISIVALAFIIVMGFLNALRISFPVMVTTTAKSTELSVVGEGKIEAVPDTAKIDVGITVDKGNTVADVQKQIDTTNNAIIAALQKIGIDKKNIQTGNYSIYPNYSYNGNDRSQNGYTGDVRLTITLKDTSKVAAAVQAATTAGANNIYGTTFSIDNPDKYREQARNMAIANAKEQANQLAKSLGIKLGKVTNIVESNANSDPGLVYEKAVMNSAGGAGGADFQAGTQTVQSVVTLYFEKQ
jgi:uncharacterized protein YggE